MAARMRTCTVAGCGARHEAGKGGTVDRCPACYQWERRNGGERTQRPVGLEVVREAKVGLTRPLETALRQAVKGEGTAESDIIRRALSVYLGVEQGAR